MTNSHNKGLRYKNVTRLRAGHGWKAEGEWRGRGENRKVRGMQYERDGHEGKEPPATQAQCPRAPGNLLPAPRATQLPLPPPLCLLVETTF